MEWEHLIVLTKALPQQLLREMNAFEAPVKMVWKQLTEDWQSTVRLDTPVKESSKNRELGRSSPY